MDHFDTLRVRSAIIDQVGKYNELLCQFNTARGWLLGLLLPGVTGLLTGALKQDTRSGLIWLMTMLASEMVVLWWFSRGTSADYIFQSPYRAALGSIFLFASPIALEPIRDPNGTVWKKVSEHYENLYKESQKANLPTSTLEKLFAAAVITELRRETILSTSARYASTRPRRNSSNPVSSNRL